jgi:hypothetical protein
MGPAADYRYDARQLDQDNEASRPLPIKGRTDLPQTTRRVYSAATLVTACPDA